MKKVSKRLKVKSSISSRFQVTKNGKVLKVTSFGRHLRRNKSKKQLRRIRRKKALHPAFARKIMRLLGKK